MNELSNLSVNAFMYSPQFSYLRSSIGIGGWIGMLLSIQLYRNEPLNLYNLWIMLVLPILCSAGFVVAEYAVIYLSYCVKIIIYSMITSHVFSLLLISSMFYITLKLAYDLVQTFKYIFNNQVYDQTNQDVNYTPVDSENSEEEIEEETASEEETANDEEETEETASEEETAGDEEETEETASEEETAGDEEETEEDTGNSETAGDEEETEETTGNSETEETDGNQESEESVGDEEESAETEKKTEDI